VDELLAVGLASRGFVTTSEALRHLDRTGLGRLVRRGELVRVRAGVYVDGRQFATADPVSRHVLSARAIAASLGEGYAVSHLSAVALHGIPVLRSDLGKIHVCTIDEGRARSDDRLQVHSPIPRAVVGHVLDTPVVSVPVAVVQAAASTGLRAGAVAADAALPRGLSREDLTTALAAARLGRGRRGAARVVALADGRSESPGESWTRLVMAEVGLPTPELQALIADETGTVVARVDFLFRRERVVVEFDGAVKYGEDGAKGQLALVAEKRREDAIRRLGYVVVRLTWTDLRGPERVRALIRAAIRLAVA
jgi:hypothetical protein